MERTNSDEGRLIIVCDWLPPDFGAVGQYMLQRAREEARRGRDVTLIGLSASIGGASCEAVGEGELRTVRLLARQPAKHRLLQRVLWTLATNLKLIAAVGKAQSGRRPAEIVVTGSPPFLSQALILTNTLWRRPLTYRITDFYPETAIASGHMRAMRHLLPLFMWMRGRADRIEVLGEDQRRRLSEGGVASEKLDLVRDASPIAIGRDTAEAPRPFGPRDVVLLYSGNLGVAHDIDTFCEGYRRHIQEGANRIRLWGNGTGSRIEALKDFCARHDLPLHLSGPVPLDELPGVLRATDAHLVLLGQAFWGYVLPSKIYACLEAGQPVLYVGPRESDIALLLTQSPHPDHQHVAPGDPAACFQALEALAARHDLAPDMTR
jgi:hypothetical protein